MAGRRFSCLPFGRRWHVHFPGNPCHDKGNDEVLLSWRKLAPLRDAMPFVKASSAAAGAGVLRHKNWMSVHGGLSSVIGDVGGSKPRADKVFSMPAYGFQSSFLGVFALLLP
jgi:hypothetical protein